MSAARDLASLIARKFWMWRVRPFVEDCVDSSNKPRLLVDVSVIIQYDAQTGIQRVVRAVWSELKDRHGTTFELVPVYATRRRGYCYAPLDFLENRSSQLRRVPVRARRTDRFLGLDLSSHLLPIHRLQIKSWRNHGAKICLVVYDLLPLIRPEFFNRQTVRHFRRWFRLLSREADAAICISRQVGRELREHLRICGAQPLDRISYIDLGGDIAASQPSTGICESISHLLTRMRFRSTILLVGTVEPRKAYDLALDAFEHLWATKGNEAPDMVIVGKPGWKTESLQRRIRNHREQGRRLHWLDQVSDEGLCSLYEASRGLLMTSHAEGFGLPLLEAVTHRRHVLARDLPVFREQDLPNVMFFEDDRPEILGAAILELASAGVDRPAMRADLPTWSASVDELLARLEIGRTPASEDDSGVRQAMRLQTN